MVTEYFDPGFSRTYIQQKDGRFYCEEIDTHVTKDFAVANGFRPISWEGNYRPSDPPFPTEAIKSRIKELAEVKSQKIEAVVDAVEGMARTFSVEEPFEIAIRHARIHLRQALENL